MCVCVYILLYIRIHSSLLISSLTLRKIISAPGSFSNTPPSSPIALLPIWLGGPNEEVFRLIRGTQRECHRWSHYAYYVSVVPLLVILLSTLAIVLSSYRTRHTNVYELCPSPNIECISYICIFIKKIIEHYNVLSFIVIKSFNRRKKNTTFVRCLSCYFFSHVFTSNNNKNYNIYYVKMYVKDYVNYTYMYIFIII